MTLRVAALGDSTSCGEGVGLRVPREQTWPALLADALPRATLCALAVAGSCVADVRRTQLPAALAYQPHLATLLIGLNDVSRGGFDARAVADDLLSTVRELRTSGATVLLGRLHDPCRHLPLPGALRRQVRDRIDVVNAAVDDAAAEHGPAAVHVLDLDAVPALRLRAAFAVDRLHPSAPAHALVAAAAADVLRAHGWRAGEVPTSPLPPRAPGAAHTAWWAARHGAPWLARHGPEVVAPALAALR